MSEEVLKSRAFTRAENNLIKKASPAFLKAYPHHVMPGYNLHRSPCIENWNEKNVAEFYQEFPYNCDLPKPLLPPAKLSRTVLSEEDPALQLITLKNQLKDDLNRIMSYCNKYQKEFNEIEKKRIKWQRGSHGYNAKIPRYITNIAELIEMDPDPYFEGAYNWYYTGGSLNFVQLNGRDVLLFPFKEELVAANIVSMEDSIWKPILRSSAKCKLHGLLYETRQTRINNTCKILTRHKNQCAFYMLTNSDNRLALTKIHHQASKIPYVSADLSLTDLNLHCTLNAERVLTLWDINKANYISTGSVLQNKTSDAWGSIKFQEMDPNVLIYTNRCCLHYIDTRTNFYRPCLTLCPKFNLENCESLSIDIPSKHYSCRYLGTYHSLLMCDNRSPKQCVRQKWTHQFKSSPLLATVTNNDDKEIIVLSSQTAGESAIIINTWLNEENSQSYNLPFVPPCIAETLNESQMQGMCLNPYLQSRFKLCNAGSVLVQSQNTGEIFHFLQNSIDDVFYQCITHDYALDKYSSVNGKAYCALDMWEKALSAQAEPLVPLTLTNKCNMQHMYENFTNRKLRLRFNDQYADEFDPTWKQSLATLGSYIDLLAPEILMMWNIRDQVPVTVASGSYQKVWNWLDTTASFPSTNANEDTLTQVPINTRESINVPEQDLAYMDDANMLEEMLPKLKLKSTNKKRLP